MEYIIWRHENAVGNSAEQTVGLAKFIVRNSDTNPKIFVETEFQYDYAMCLPNVTSDDIEYIDGSICDLTSLQSIINNPKYANAHIPSVYSGWGKGRVYPGAWAELSDEPDVALKFPHKSYDNRFNLPDNAVVIQLREAGTYWKRVDGANAEPHRFVNPDTFFRVALHLAKLGHKVVRIGDKNQTPFPSHENIIDFAKIDGRRMLDDLYALSVSKVFLSCDSGVWPMAGGMKTNMVLSNVAGTHYTQWLSKENSTVLFKRGFDNTFDELMAAISKYI